MTSADQTLQLRFFEPKRPEVAFAPAMALVHSLGELQRLVHLIAMRREGHTPGRQIQPSADIQNRYRLVCEVPAAGSYIVPVRIEGAERLAQADAAAVFADLEGLLSAVGAQDEAALRAAVPDNGWRRRYLKVLSRLSPPPISRVELEITRAGKPLVETPRLRLFIERFSPPSISHAELEITHAGKPLVETPLFEHLVPASTEQFAQGSVVGEFKRIDFQRREITIRHTETGRDLTCLYEDHVEDNLLEHPRDQLLVLGTITRDEKGLPVSIENVDHIEPIDLNPIKIGPVQVGDSIVTSKEPLFASVSFNEVDVLYLAAIDNLGVSVFGETREMVTAAIEDEIAVLWSRYACAPDEKLTRAARALKARVNSAFCEESHAAQTS